jgi:hypothetical protein
MPVHWQRFRVYVAVSLRHLQSMENQ